MLPPTMSGNAKESEDESVTFFVYKSFCDQFLSSYSCYDHAEIIELPIIVMEIL